MSFRAGARPGRAENPGRVRYARAAGSPSAREHGDSPRGVREGGRLRRREVRGGPGRRKG
ncbi:hypothetical protein SCATT_02720 [Streptantibioticus cattleyicolor NRRL 8057 = DSM 46488]|uniref:Uncharacterized protein n=1 Tax=Streptantibioticus cattleyicolor (strain ATCC 35852 / DSM 46488 / JCM 4925 / NBRC 14057 / NRRL 8057) TaxID=1003195 RepID=G8WMS6_STREN|nr:hypothetical protein SCATT_02720 [Streptantibioticus cattleyicolor NRRL 8057 = DSM 46488]